MTKKSNEILIFEQNHKLWTNSADIAEKFKKSHKSVLRAISNLECSQEFSRRNFALSNYIIRGKEYTCFNITKDGVSFLVMGFTGKEAAQWKERYIEGFNFLLEQNQSLKEQLLKNQSDADTQLSRIEGKITRRKLTDTIAIFIEYARAQGSSQPEMYYQVISKLSNRLFVFNESLRKNPHKRDYMESVQLKELDNIEEKLAQAITLGMKERIAYKSIYALCKDRVDRYIQIFGTSPVIAQIEQTQYSLLN